MTLQQLEYILALDRYGNFAKAAFACNVTQPTLSAMIQKLETELDMKIFDRRRQPIVATRDGRAVIDQAKEVLYQTRRIKQKRRRTRSQGPSPSASCQPSRLTSSRSSSRR